MAPELFQGRYTSAVDVYAFAILIFEMVVGKNPYPGMNIYQISATVAQGNNLITYKNNL